MPAGNWSYSPRGICSVEKLKPGTTRLMASAKPHYRPEETQGLIVRLLCRSRVSSQRAATLDDMSVAMVPLLLPMLHAF